MTQSADSSCSVPLVEIRISGALDAARLPIAGAVLAAALRLRPGCLVVDLAECSGLDAAAIEVLLDAHRELSRTGSRLTLRAPTPRLRRILRIARVDHVLDTIPGPTLGQFDERPPSPGAASEQPLPLPLAGEPTHARPTVPDVGTQAPHAS